MDRLRYHHHHHHHLTRPFRSPLTLSSGFFVSFSLRNSSLGKELYGFSPAIKPQLLISLLFLALALATLYKRSFYGMLGGCTHICQANQKASTCNVSFLVSFNMPMYSTGFTYALKRV